MAEKLFYSMGEVAEMFDVNQSLIRYWGKQFDAIKPKRNKKGNRMFTPEDVETLKVIYHLVKERGMTLEGAKRALKAQKFVPAESASRESELLERLQHLKAMLLQVREQLGGETGITVTDADDMPEDVATETPTATAATHSDKRVPKSKRKEPDTTEDNTEPQAKEESVSATEQKGKQALPFYEQTLF